MDWQLVTDVPANEVKNLRLSASPRFADFKPFTDTLLAVHRVKTKVVLNKPMAVGVATLFHY